MNQTFSFNEISCLWKEKKRNQVKLTSLAAYSTCIDKYLLPVFHNITDITEQSVRKFIETKLKDGLSLKSIRDILVVLKMIVRFAGSMHIPVDWDCRLLLPKDLKNKSLHVFTQSQQTMLMNYLTSNQTPKNIGILICLSTGLRIGEICGIKWKDMDLKSETLSVNKTVCRTYLENQDLKKTEVLITSPKTLHSYRTIPLPTQVKRILAKISKGKDPEMFFLTSSSRPMEPRTYRNYFRKVLKSLGLPQVKFHCLRHSFATRCIENQCDYKTVSAILGHADISTTLNLYVHPSFDQKRRCIETMVSSISSGG